MILHGNERGFGAELARHLLNPRDNDHVTVHAIEGFVANDLEGAFAESAAIAQGTRCQKYLFSLSLNPPPGANVTVDVFEKTIGQIEAKLGLTGQPRAIVFHEKHGRRHAHCVWSRIDVTRMRAINLPHTKRKLMDISIALYRNHGWSMPEGFLDHERRDPLNFSEVEAAQAKRADHDPKTVKAIFKRCWEQSDSRSSFAAALWAEGYCLARGNRRGFVAVDSAGKIWSLSRWCDVDTEALHTRLGDMADLPSIEEAAKLFEDVAQPASTAPRLAPDQDSGQRLRRLVEAQRRERDMLLALQERRLVAETQARNARLPRGLKAAWARLNGRYARLIQDLVQETASCTDRDRAERQALIERHLEARRALERQRNAPSLTKALDELFVAAVKPDSRQRLVLPRNVPPFTVRDLAANPDLILAHISRTKASFSEMDVKRRLAEFLDDPLLLRAAIDKALVSADMIRLEDGKFTTRDYRGTEHRLDADIRALHAAGGFSVAVAHVERAMRNQDAKLQERFGGSLSNEQRAALRHILADRQFASVVGLAGSGKSTMLETARHAWEHQRIRVHGAALSGKAADGLQNASGIESRTLASLETSWENGYEPIAKGDVLIIDEAGMVGTRQMARIAAKLKDIGAKLVLVGDPGQLQPIEAGTPFEHLIEQLGAAYLKEIHRQKEAWQRHASRDLAEGRIQEAINAYDADGCVHRSANRDLALASLLENYLADRETLGPGSTQLAFAHRRKDVFTLNQAIRNALRLSAPAEPEILLNTSNGPRAFAAGDRIVFTRNDKETGVKNGMLGTVERVAGDKIVVRLENPAGSRITFDVNRYRDFDHGYAVTIHKSQGATVDRAYVLASRTMDDHLLYVAMTRHRHALRVHINAEDHLTWVNTERPRTRTNVRRQTLDST